MLKQLRALGLVLAVLLSTAMFIPALAEQLPAQQNPGGLTSSPAMSTGAETNIPTPGTVLDEVKLDVPKPVLKTRIQSPGFMVKRIQVEGSTVLDEPAWRDVVARYEGQEQTLETLQGAVDALGELYREQGYLTAQVYIPPQDLQAGILTIRVREGRLGEIKLEGNKYYRAHVIERNLSQEPGSLLNFQTLQQELNRSNRVNEGYKLKAVLAAGDEPGETDIRLQVAERFPLQITPSFDNQGRPFIGRYRGGLEFRNDSLTGNGDRLYSRWLEAEGTRVLMGSYSIPINRFGTEIGADYAYSSVDVKLDIQDPPKITGKAYNYGLRLSQPLDRDQEWTADVGANWKRISTYFEDVNTETTDIRSLQAGLTFDKRDRWGRTYNRLQNTVGVGTLGANAKFWKLENYFTRLITLPKRNMIILRAYGQLTPDALPAAEQFQIGGAYSVRGYTQGLLIGDRGFNVGIEHRFPIPGLKYVSSWLDKRVQGAWFYDMGRVWTDKSSDTYISGHSDLTERTLLQGIGVGLRAQLTRFAQGFIDVGFGLGNREDIEPERRQPTARVHFGIRSDIFSNDYRMREPAFKPLTPRQVSIKHP